MRQIANALKKKRIRDEMRKEQASTSNFNDPDVVSCKNKSQLSCEQGSCYNLSKVCKYQLDENGLLLPCQMGQHLENCATFECNMGYKCLKSFCIPYSYLCDGK